MNTAVIVHLCTRLVCRFIRLDYRVGTRHNNTITYADRTACADRRQTLWQ